MTLAKSATPALDRLRGLINARTGLDFTQNFHAAVEAGIQSVMKRSGVNDLASFQRLITVDAEVFDALIAELTIGETYFFREPNQFEFIRTQIWPELNQRLGEDHLIKIWSAGCASGEEAYSLAMLATQEGLARRTSILGTDVSPPALQRAQAGFYRAWSLRGEGPLKAQPYLNAHLDGYQLEPKIRGLVAFRQLNLAMDVYPAVATATTELDLILCRNVMIYFDTETTKQVVRRLHACLRPGGWLILASSDPSLLDLGLFAPVVNSYGLFYRRLDTAPETKSVPSLSLVPAVEEPVNAWSAETSAAAPELPAVQAVQRVQGVLPLEAAQSAFTRGDYALAADLAAPLVGQLEGALVYARSKANSDPEAGLAATDRLLVSHGVAPDMHFLHAVLLIESRRSAEAIVALRRVLFLDRTLAMAHFLLGQLLRQSGDSAGALRSFRNAQKLCAEHPESDLVRLADGERYRQLAQAASAEIAHLTALAPGEV